MSVGKIPRKFTDGNIPSVFPFVFIGFLVVTIHKGVDKIRYIMANTTLNLCHGGLQEVREAECFETSLTEDEIA
jgi:hypothetical protein